MAGAALAGVVLKLARGAARLRGARRRDWPCGAEARRRARAAIFLAVSPALQLDGVNQKITSTAS